MLGDVGEPAQGFDVAGPHQGSLNSRGHAFGRSSVEDLSHSQVGSTVTFGGEGEAYPGGSGRPHPGVELKHSTWFDRNDSRHIPHVQRPRTHETLLG